MIKTIATTERYGMNSASGNPRYRVTFTDGTVALTKKDSDVNYGISNSDLLGWPVLVTFERGEVAMVEKINLDYDKPLPFDDTAHFTTFCSVCGKRLATISDDIYPGDEAYTYRCEDDKVRRVNQ